MDDTDKEMLLTISRQLNTLWFAVSALMTNLSAQDPALKLRMLATLRTVQSSEPEGQLWIDEAAALIDSLP
jgi:hypothetical protein